MSTRRILFAAALLAVAVTHGTKIYAQEEQKWESLAREAKEHFEKGDFAKAEQSARQALVAGT